MFCGTFFFVCSGDSKEKKFTHIGLTITLDKTLENTQYFYAINFGCLKKNSDKNKTLYEKWVKIIEIEK